MSFATTQPNVEEQLLWKQTCEAHRRLARECPAYDIRMSALDEFGWRFGPWSCRLVHETWRSKPRWHASIAVLEEIGSVLILQGVEGPQDAMLAVNSWSPEHLDTARQLLADMVGPLLKAGDRQQPAKETLGMMAMHWEIEGA